MTRLNLSGFERVVTKVDSGDYEQVGAIPCELAVVKAMARLLEARCQQREGMHERRDLELRVAWLVGRQAQPAR